MGVAFKVVGIEAHVNAVCPVTAQGVDPHIHCDISVGMLNQGDLVDVIAEAVGNHNVFTKDCCAVAVNAVACKAGISSAAGDGGLAQIKTYGLRTFQLDVGNGNGVSVVNTVRNLRVPFRTAEDADTDAGELFVNQILRSIQCNSLLLAFSESDKICIFVMGVAFEAVIIETDLNVVCPVAA